MTAQVHAPVIDVQGLEKSFKDVHVLRGVNLEIARGSIFALLGPNGSGKTTTVKILSTLLKADAGTVRVNGFDVATHGAQVRESISLTGQFAAVDEILSGRENLVLVARLRHREDPGRLADGLLARFSLTDAGERGNEFSDVIDVPPPARGGRPFLQGLVSLAGAAGIALAVPFVILLIGLPVALAVRGLLEVVG